MVSIIDHSANRLVNFPTSKHFLILGMVAGCKALRLIPDQMLHKRTLVLRRLVY